MHRSAILIFIASSLSCACLAGLAHADDLDALDLKSVPPAVEATKESGLRAAIEIAAGRIWRRDENRSQDGRRTSFDLRYSAPLSESWRAALSDRLDDTHPALDGQRTTSNSLREAYVTWQEEGASASADFGRVNVRQGPAFGYNPTDYFRTGALRTITTLDPVTLREMRMGTVMGRLGLLWSGGGASLALAPKLDNGPDQRPASLDVGATNASDRMVVSASQRLSERYGVQGSILLQSRRSATIGGSITALPTDALVGYAEWSYGPVPRALDSVLGVQAPADRVHQVALGLTYTLPSALALTLEAEYNGAGLDRAGWATVLALGPAGYQRYEALIQPGQDLGSRRAWLLYASQKSVGFKQLDFTGFVRVNAIDHSRLFWAELRYHWTRFDAALQWQRSAGSAGSEFSVIPYRRVLQLVGSFYM